MSELEKQQEVVDSCQRQMQDEIDELMHLKAQRNKYEERVQKQEAVIVSKRNELTLAKNHLEDIKSGKTDLALDKYSFKCDSCGKIHKESMYCIAQRASGKSMKHTCDCGHVTHLEPYKN